MYKSDALFRRKPFCVWRGLGSNKDEWTRNAGNSAIENLCIIIIIIIIIKAKVGEGRIADSEHKKQVVLLTDIPSYHQANNRNLKQNEAKRACVESTDKRTLRFCIHNTKNSNFYICQTRRSSGVVKTFW